MAVRVWTSPKKAAVRGDWIDYPKADAYAVDAEHELDVSTNGRLIATFAPGNWCHVEWTEVAR